MSHDRGCFRCFEDTRSDCRRIDCPYQEEKEIIMSTKVPQEYLDFDFGFTGVDEDEIKQDVLQELDAKDQALTEKEQELQRKIKTLEAIIVPLLNNLIKTSDRAYIHWPNRKDKCTEMLDLVLKTTRGLE
jgi:hypothetical protein